MKYNIHVTQAAERDMANAYDYIDLVLKNPTGAALICWMWPTKKSEHWQNSRTNLKSFPTSCFPYGVSASPSL